jgi:hypothetical protein
MHCGADPNGKAKRKPSDSKENRWRNFHIDEIRKRDYKIDTMPSARHSAESRCYSSKMHKELEQRLVER